MAIQFVKSQFMRTSEGTSNKLTIKSDTESSLVDKSFEISNLDLMKDLEKVVYEPNGMAQFSPVS